MWEVFSPTQQQVTSCDRPGCKFQNSVIETFISDPLPEVFVLNFNWSNPDIQAMELLNIYMSFRDDITMSLFYKMN